jgi:hypothetical protein
MKNFIVFFVLIIMSLPAFAQRRPHPHPRFPQPHPRPMPHPRPVPVPPPSYSCQVYMVDSFNRVLNRYWGRTDWRTGVCVDAMNRCRMDLRYSGHWNARCVQPR